MTTDTQVTTPAMQTQAVPRYTVSERQPRFLLHGVLPAAASALLLWCCFFPLALGWLGWVALVPLLCLVRSKLRPRAACLAAWIGGLLFFWPVLQWMRVADFRMYFTWAMLATYCSFYFPVAVYLMRRLDRLGTVPLMVNVACVWIALEYVRSFLLTGFAWYYLGHTQHDFLPMIQIADVTGVYGVSFLVAAVNAWIFVVLFRMPRFRDALALREDVHDRRIAEQGVLLFLVLVATFVYGLHRLSESEFTRGPRLAMLQGNLPQRVRNEAFDPKSKRNPTVDILRHYLQLCGVAVTRQHVRPDLVVWPETSYPLTWCEISEKADLTDLPEQARNAARIHALVQELAAMINDPNADTRTDSLLGVNSVFINDQSEEVLFNSALMLRANGAWGPRHDKMHRIPFGEYVPLDWIPFMKDLMPYDFPYSITPGSKFTRFEQGEHRFGVLVCYEDTDPFIARHYGRAEADGPAVDFLVNMSNDGWFHGTSEHEEHLAISRFRAVEARRALARAVNVGVSALIDPNGRVLKPNTIEMHELVDEKGKPQEPLHSWFDRGADLEDLPVSDWHKYKKVAGVLAMHVPIDHRTSWYALWGDWLPWLCWAVVLTGVIVSLCLRKPKLASEVA